eukprot:scaffold3749_cov119-Isochrysis_galbana.AAC.2
MSVAADGFAPRATLARVALARTRNDGGELPPPDSGDVRKRRPGPVKFCLQVLQSLFGGLCATTAAA